MPMKFDIVCEMYRLGTMQLLILFNGKHYTELDLLTECNAALIICLSHLYCSRKSCCL